MVSHPVAQVGVITLSSNSSSLCVIKSLNAQAMTILGSTRNGLLGRKLDTLLPDPLSTSVLTYVKEGQESGMQVLTSRGCIACHRDSL